MPSLLRTRDLNVQKNQDTTNSKAAGPVKHKSFGDDEKDGPTRPKRVALGDITEALSTTLIDSSKKPANSASQTSVSAAGSTSAAHRLLPISEQELASALEVDPAPNYDFDKENANDPFAVSEFACDIFKYYKHRERCFHVHDYFDTLKVFTRKERATAIDWLVQIQESFELNHETMYLAVKLMDLFISKSQPQSLIKSIFQLIPCAAVFIASKVEERSAPTIEDLLYLCKNAYSADQLKKMEREMLRVVGFDLGVPLSYSFLRRYGRVIKAPMQLLTTARYYLEVSLHYLKFCTMSESKVAAACLLLALRVTKTGDWNPILEKYSGYKLGDIEQLMLEVNHMVRRFATECKSMQCVREKYSHPIFFEVAKQAMLADRLKGPVEN